MTGFIRPGGDFDFCVVIRSVIANSELKKLILPAGSAITLMSSDELEFKECLLKMDSMIHALCTNEERLRA
jgi:para-aminobenzoate synthetase component 1